MQTKRFGTSEIRTDGAWDVLIGLLVAGACIAALTRSCVYICNHFQIQGQNTSKQKFESASLFQKSQIEFQRQS